MAQEDLGHSPPNERKGSTGHSGAEQAQHTPAPWSVSARALGRAFKFKRFHWAIVGTKFLNGIAIAFGDTDADARLIAAAPDLLAAVRTTQCPHPPTGCPTPHDWTVEQCRGASDCGCDLGAAFAKATGAAP